MKQKRILAVNDLSDIGRCSLTVALPIISACGIETSVLPTAILSTHTGGFEGYTYRDLSQDIIPVTNHWRSLNICFDAVYSGFLGSFDQLEMMYTLFNNYKAQGATVVIDPVLGDNGSLYPVFTADFIHGMQKLCSIADIITPNMTEASLLTGLPYDPDRQGQDLSILLKELSKYTLRYVVLTGVKNKNDIGVAIYDKELDSIDIISNIQVDGIFHGTGDVFASALTGAYVRTKSIHTAAKIAVEFTLNSILLTKNNGTEYRYGVDFEESLPILMKGLDII